MQKELNYRIHGRTSSHVSKKNKDLLENNLKSYLFDIPILSSLNFSKVILEIGFGSGEHIYHLAKENPNFLYIGSEVYLNGIAALLDKLSNNHLSNLLIYPKDVRLLLDDLILNKIDFLSEVYIYYPDPWPKSKHNKRRIINNTTIPQIFNLMSSNSNLYIATDSQDYKNHILQLFNSLNLFEWIIQDISEIHTPPPNHYPTKYELKALKNNLKPYYFTFSKNIIKSIAK